MQPPAGPDTAPPAPPGAPQSAAADAARLMSEARTAALATLDRATGHPFASLVTVALDAHGAPIMLVSQLARHTQNLKGDARASLLFTPDRLAEGDPLAGARVTVVGRVAGLDVAEAGYDDARARFLARHPDAEGYAGFADFGFVRLEVARAYFIGGFGRIVELGAAELAAGQARG